MRWIPWKHRTLDELEDYLAHVRASLNVCDGIALEEYKRLKRIEAEVMTEISEKSKSVKVFLG